MTPDLPRHLTVDDVRGAASEADTLLDAQNLMRVGRTEARRVLREHGLLDDVVAAGPETVGQVRGHLEAQYKCQECDRSRLRRTAAERFRCVACGHVVRGQGL